MKKTLFTTLVIAIFSFLSVDTFAQGANGPPTNGGPTSAGPAPCPPNCPAIPIDGGISLLAALGLGFGAKKLKDAKNDKASLA